VSPKDEPAKEEPINEKSVTKGSTSMAAEVFNSDKIKVAKDSLEVVNTLVGAGGSVV
jgi:hypothetical protein